MALVYDFSFTPDFAGQSAAVTDAAGSSVTGSPATLDASGVASLSLDEGAYTATVSNTALGKGNSKTAGVLNLPASIAAGGGGGGGVTGAAAWFLLSKTGVAIGAGTATGTHVNFAEMDDGRAPARPDLVVVDDGDASTLTVIEGGEYLVFLMPRVSTSGATAGVGELWANVEINGDDEAPAYYLETGGLFPIPAMAGRAGAGQPMTFQQTLVAGDTIQVKFRVGLGDAEDDDATWATNSGSVFALTKIG